MQLPCHDVEVGTRNRGTWVLRMERRAADAKRMGMDVKMMSKLRLWSTGHHANAAAPSFPNSSSGRWQAPTPQLRRQLEMCKKVSRDYETPRKGYYQRAPYQPRRFRSKWHMRCRLAHSFSAMERKPKLAAMHVNVTALGQSLVNPWLSFTPRAHPTSNKPAIRN